MTLLQRRLFRGKVWQILNAPLLRGISGTEVFFCICVPAVVRYTGNNIMDEVKRIALLGIIVEDTGATEAINRILHEYGEYIVGRMGIPYRSRGVSIISVVLDAPADKVSALSGRLGMLEGVSVKALYSKR